MVQSIGYDEQSMKKIAAVSTEYHEVGKHVKNVGRAMTGKELIQEAKPVGRLADMMMAPFQLDRTVSSAVKHQVEKAIKSLENLEQRAVRQQEAKTAGKSEKKPSILKNLQNFKEQAAQTAQNTPAPQRKKSEVSL